jgi:circadian clock protein KaiC
MGGPKGTAARTPRIARVGTGVPGLDEVLCGGLLRGGVNLVVGPPGAGKTVLAAQIAFRHAASGGRVVFVTILTEPHGRMVEHLRGMDFFEERAVGDTVYFVSGYRELEKTGLPGLLELLRSTVRERRASLLVVDGAAILTALANTQAEVQRFTHELSAFLEPAGCTGIVLSTGDASLAEQAMVESIVVLQTRAVAARSLRELQVTKLRGSEILEGTHPYWIGSSGISVFPRTEALAARAAAARGSAEGEASRDPRRLAFGVGALDEMLRGGLPSMTGTSLLGAPGTGKTLLGCAFLSAGAERGERGLYFGFFEPPARLIAKLDGIGLPFRRHHDAGAIAVVWQPPVERLLDSLAKRLLHGVERTRATRVVIDGIDGFRSVAPDPGRLPGFLIGLTNELRALGATTVLTEETDLFGAELAVPLRFLSAAVDNVILLEYADPRAGERRSVSVVKVRDSAHDGSPRGLRITDAGIAVSPSRERIRAVRAGGPSAKRRRAEAPGRGARGKGRR